MDDPQPTIEFVYASIADTVGTIRAIDGKLHILLGLLVIPVAAGFFAPESFLHTLKAFQGAECPWLVYLGLVATFAAFGAWAISLLFTLTGISGIRNPAAVVRDAEATSSFFTCGRLERPGWLPRGYRFDRPFSQHLEQLPTTRDQVLKELAYEQMKLFAIRDLKMKRQKTAMISLGVAVGLVSLLWLLLLILTLT